MSAAAVLYTLKLGGDLADKLPSLSSGLRKVGQAALDTKAAVASIGSGARSGLASVGEHGKTAAEGVFKAAAGFAALGYATHSVLKSNEQYEQSTARLMIASQKLGTQIADALGPSVAKFIDSFTIGLVYIANLMGGVVGPAVSTLSNVVGRLTDALGHSLTAWKRIATGDFSGAAESIKANHAALFGLVDDVKEGFAGIDKARDDAFKAAFEAWRRQVDGIKDVVGEIQKSYADIVTTISGIRSTQLQGFVEQAPGGIPMGQQVTDHIEVTPDTGLQTQQVNETKNVVEGVTGVTTAIQGGATAMLAMMGPWGAMIAGIFTVMQNLSNIVESTNQMAIDTLRNFSSQFKDVVGRLTRDLLDALPQMITDFSTLIPEMANSILESMPEIIEGLVIAILKTPAMVVEGIWNSLKNVWEMAKDWFDKALDWLQNAFGGGKDNNILTGKDGKWLGTSFAGKENEGNRSLFGFDLPSFDTGGHVSRTGLAQVHAGEFVVNAQTMRQLQQGGGGRQVTSANVTIHVHGTNDVEQLVRDIRAKLGTYGIGLTLNPYTGG